MDIVKEKEKFISLLRLTYNARKTNGAGILDDGNFERIHIGQQILFKYGFDGRDFWEIICPALKEEGYLKSFHDPFFSFTIQTSLEKDSQYMDLKKKRSELDMSLPSSYSLAKSLSGKSEEEFMNSIVLPGDEKRRIKYIEGQIKEVDKNLENIENYRKKNFYHEFIVNAVIIDKKIPTVELNDNKRKCHITEIDGSYFLNDKPLDIRNNRAQYIRIFKITHSLSPDGGEILYKSIIDSYYHVHKKKLNKEKILRALTGDNANLFEYLPMLRRSDKKLFEPVRDGKNVIYNNKAS